MLSSRSSVKVASFACERAARRFHAELSSDDSFRARARRLCGIIAMGERERCVTLVCQLRCKYIIYLICRGIADFTLFMRL